MAITYSPIIKLFITVFISLLLTPIIKLVVFRIGAVDRPNERRINKVVMPSAGGLAIYITFALSTLFLFGNVIPTSFMVSVLIGSGIIVVTGFIDDLRELTPKTKMLGVVLGALYIYFIADIHMDSLSIPFLGTIQLEWLSFPVTLLWIISITHALNLIDGLDGLASGVSVIGLATIGIVGYFSLHVSTSYIPIVIFVLVASIVGFLPYNFYPAKIYLGDTGALFLGFMIAVLSLRGLKNATFITLITPLLILGVPITDTFFAIVRRFINKQKISTADHMHLHHRLLSLGFSHKGAVLTIYGLALVFSFISLLFNYASQIASFMLVIALLIGLELFVELIGLVGENHQPLLYILRLFGNKDFRRRELEKYKKKK